MILSWDKPGKVMSEQDRRDTFASDSGVPGTFVPNMSNADVARWKAKLVGHKSGHPQVEIRKDSTVIIVSLHGGYRYKHYGNPNSPWPSSTAGINLHIATAGPIQWSWKDYEEFQQAIAEAREFLEKLET